MADSEHKCPFCQHPLTVQTAADHVKECLERHSKDHIDRSQQDALSANTVRVVTAGCKLMTSEEKSYALEIPVESLKCGDGALQAELKRRLHCLVSGYDKSFTCDAPLGISNDYGFSRLHARGEP